MNPLRLAIIPCLLGLPLPLGASDPKSEASGTRPTAVGEKAPGGHDLRDLRGNRRSLQDIKGGDATVLIFLGAECPMSNLYLPGIIDLCQKHRKRSVQFVGVYPNATEDVVTP